MGAGAGLAFFTFGTVAATFVAGAIDVLATALKDYRGSEKLLERTREEARQVLEGSRYKQSIFSLVDSAHGGPGGSHAED